jgi:hypothetical protein
MEPRYTNISQIKAANKAAGRFWFSPDTIRFFQSRVESRVYTSRDGLTRLWVESTTNWDDSAREFKVSRFDTVSHDIEYVQTEDYDVFRFDKLADAKAYLTEHVLPKV